MKGAFSRFYSNSIKPRYANLYGMELYSYDIDFHSSVLGAPYGDYSKGLFREGQYAYDADGVFVFIGSNVEFQYNPCGIAEYALVSYEKMIREGKGNESFRAQIEWLEKHCVQIDDDKIVWYYDYVDDGFFSGISQGMAMCTLLRAYQYFNDEKYLKLAWQSFNFMNTSLVDGGTRCDESPFLCWYEEHPAEKSKILNGHIYSLLGVYDLYRVTGDARVKECFDAGIQSIKDSIDKYDLGFFTRYDAVSAYPANNSYHYTHITLFKILYGITGDAFFDKYAKRFEKYQYGWYYKLRNIMYILKLTLKGKIK